MDIQQPCVDSYGFVICHGKDIDALTNRAPMARAPPINLPPKRPPKSPPKRPPKSPPKKPPKSPVKKPPVKSPPKSPSNRPPKQPSPKKPKKTPKGSSSTTVTGPSATVTIPAQRPVGSGATLLPSGTGSGTQSTTTPQATPAPQSTQIDANVSALIDSILADQKRDDSSVPHLRLPRSIYKLHTQALQDFSLAHPDVRPIDILAADMAQSTYIENDAMLKEFIDNVSSIREQGWELDPDPKTRNEFMKTYRNSKTGKIAVFYRGTVNWLSEDGVSNLSNTVGLTKIRQTMADETGVDLRFQKAKLIEETNSYILRTKSVENVVLTGGHSQGSWNAVDGQQTKFTEAEVITFNPAPGGTVPEEFGRSFVTPNDFVSIVGKTVHETLGKGSANVITVNSTAPTSLMSVLSGGHLMGGTFAAEAPTEATLTGKDVEFTHEEIRTALRSRDDSFASFMKAKGITNLSILTADDEVVKVWQKEYDAMTKNFNPQYRQQHPAFDSVEFDAIHERFRPEPMVKSGPAPNILGRGITLAHTGVGLGVGMATGELLNQLGVTNPYANATISGGVGGAAPSLLKNGVNSALFSLTAKYGARVTGEELLTGALRGGAEGALLAPVAVGLDQLLNGYYRRAGMSIAGSNALSGFVSTTAVGALGIATSVAAGELALGPEMLPAVAMTLLMGEIVALIGAKEGKDEESIKKENTERVDAQYKLIQSLQANDFDVARAQSALSAAERKLIDATFMQTVTNALEGKQPPSSGLKSSADIEREHQKQLNDMKALALAGVNQQYAVRQYQVDLDQARTRERMQQLQGKLISAHMNATVNNTQYVNPLTDSETSELEGMDPDYARRAEMYANMYNSQAVHYATTQQQLETAVEERVANGETFTLTDEERAMLAADSSFAVRLQESMQPRIDQEYADELGLSLDRYLNMVADVHNGDSDSDEAYLEALTAEAKEKGYADVENYIADFESGTEQQLKLESEQRKKLALTEEQYLTFVEKSGEPGANSDEVYKSMILNIARNAGYTSVDDYLEDQADGTQTALEMEKVELSKFSEAQQDLEGSETIDEHRFKADMSEWTPEVSQILRAHAMGLNSEQYRNYMQRLTADANESIRKNAFIYALNLRRDEDTGKLHGYTDAELTALNQADFAQLQTDLKSAGFDPNMYNVDFSRHETVSGERNIGDEDVDANLPESVVSSAVEERESVDDTIQENLE